jgi:hypothetical protein
VLVRALCVCVCVCCVCCVCAVCVGNVQARAALESAASKLGLAVGTVDGTVAVSCAVTQAEWPTDPYGPLASHRCICVRMQRLDGTASEVGGQAGVCVRKRAGVRVVMHHMHMMHMMRHSRAT